MTPSQPLDNECRIGLGNDIHRLSAGRRLILGGVEIPFEKGLLGHSDADSLSHAIADALLGAAGLGDIGTHFSDQDPAWKDAGGLVILDHVCAMLAKHAFRIVNIDSTILAEQPKMKPYIPIMRTRLAEALAVPETSVSIKAKTNEGLDAIGRGEAIGAVAVALIARTIDTTPANQ